MSKRPIISLTVAAILSATAAQASAQGWQNPANPPPPPEKQAPAVERNLFMFDTHFALGMITVGHWKGKTMDHEWLFWDNQDFMKQIGLAQ